MLDYAMQALALGYCVMPATEDGTKQPLGNSHADRRWKQYQTILPTQRKIEEWYATGLKNIGFICGAVSGNLEVIDFDDADCYHEFKGAAVSCGLGEIVARIESGYLEHSPKGVHWFYRCDEIAGNLKLASREKRPEEKQHDKDKIQVMIETRGEGGFIIAAPSSGPVNPKGEYTLVSGSLETVATITPAERAELHHLAMSFDRMPKSLEYAEVNQFGVERDGIRPGDDFAERTSWDEILVPHGWKRCFSRGDEAFWTRPGKQFGISATSNYAGSNLFYVFSTSTDFEPNRGFSKFAVHTYLNHHGDFEAAASALGSEGFGSRPEDQFVEDRPLKFKKSSKPEEQADPNIIPEKLMDIPGLVNDVQEWLNRCAIRKQPTFAFASALALAGLLMGRKVRTQTGLRTNLLILALGDSASGKNSARDQIRQALIETDNMSMIGAETIGSEAGLLDELYEQGGHAIYQLDEIGHALQAMTGKRAASYLSAIIPTLMKLQSSAGRTWIGRSLKRNKDNGKRQDIHDPIVVVYATSVPDKYYSAIDYSNIEDGFVPRFLVFQTNTPFPPLNYSAHDGSTPPSIIEHIETWTRQEYRSSRLIKRGGYDTVRTVRHTPETMTAMRHFETMVQDSYHKFRPQKLHSVWGRAQATAEQLSLLFTCSQNPDADFLDPLMVAKACMLTKYLCDQQMVRLDRNVSGGEHEGELKAVLRTIEDGGWCGVSRKQLVRSNQNIKLNQLTSILTLLAESGRIIIKKEKIGESQKPSTLYFAEKFCEVTEFVTQDDQDKNKTK